MHLKAVLVFFCFVLTVRSQTSQNTIFDKVDTRELNNSFVISLFQDQKGYLWVGTLAGLNRYDGYSFKTYRSAEKDSLTLSSSVVTAFAQLDEQRILACTRKGLNIFDYRSNSFTRVPFLTEAANQNQILSIVQSSSGKFILGTANGIALFNSGSGKIEPVKSGAGVLLEGWTVQSVCFDRRGKLWAGARRMAEDGNLLSRVFACDLKSGELKELTAFNGGSSGHTGISEDYLGHIWVSVDDGLVNIDPLTYELKYFKAPENFYSNVSYHHTRDNTIWQCYWSFGLTAFDIDRKEYRVFRNDPDNPKSLMSNKCWAILKDDNDILWIGSDIGLQKLTNSRPSMQVIKRNYKDPANSFTANRINAVMPSQKLHGIIYVGIDGEGFSVYDRETQRALNFGPAAAFKNAERQVNQFYEDAKGDLYIAGQNHFQKLSWPGTKPAVKTFFGLQEHYCASIVEDPSDSNILWVGGKNEILRFDKNSQTAESFPKPDGASGVFQSGFTVSNKVYFTSANGILKWDPATLSGKLIATSDAGSLSASRLVNDTSVFISSQNSGLIRFNPSTGRTSVVHKPNEQLFPQVNDLVFYKSFLWLATNNGLIKWNPQSREYSEISSEDGLPSATVHQLKFSEGYLYIATQGGLAIFNPDFQVSHFHIPRAEITSVKGIGNNFVKELPQNSSEIVLNESQNSFQISFTVFDFNLPEKNSFRYRLSPLYNEWRELGNQHSVNFNDLAPGTYVFELMGANADNTWSAEPVLLTIRIVPPFYKRTWFIALCILSILLAAVIFVVLRFRANIHRQKRLEEIITLRTAEIREKRAELLDSITYAERIQKAIFVGEEILRENIRESFIFNKPKDKVSGDFFWIGQIESCLIVFAGDCTGHGVPGAMLSIVGTSLLNKVVYEEKKTKPGEILSRLNHLFYHQMNLKESHIRDGMDASIFTLNLASRELWFAGAKNDACLVSGESLQELKAQRSSIGEHPDVVFHSQKVKAERGDMVYLFSDGIKDQFGGPKLKKLSSKRFKQILLKTASLNIENQLLYINDSLNTWKASLPQTDDILVIGVRV